MNRRHSEPERVRRAVEEDLAPGFSFADQLAATAEEVGSGLPEWMDGAAGTAGGPERNGLDPSVRLRSRWCFSILRSHRLFRASLGRPVSCAGLD